MREFTIGKNDAGQRLDRFLGKTLPLLMFNARYLSDSLRAISDDFVKLCFTTSTAPGVIVPTEKKEDEYLYLILPVRIIN